MNNLVILIMFGPGPVVTHLRRTALNSYYRIQRWFNPSEGAILEKCMGFVPTKHDEEFGLLLIYNPGLESWLDDLSPLSVD